MKYFSKACTRVLLELFCVFVEESPKITIIEKFLEEALLLAHLCHANVLCTLGICISQADKPQVVLPYMANGDLKSLIRNENLVSSLTYTRNIRLVDQKKEKDISGGMLPISREERSVL